MKDISIFFPTGNNEPFCIQLIYENQGLLFRIIEYHQLINKNTRSLVHSIIQSDGNRLLINQEINQI